MWFTSKSFPHKKLFLIAKNITSKNIWYHNNQFHSHILHISKQLPLSDFKLTAIVMDPLIYLLFFSTSADIVFIVKDKPHPIFKRDDDNIIYTATVPLGKVSTSSIILNRRQLSPTPRRP